MNYKQKKISRRSFLKSVGISSAVLSCPTLVPSSVFGANAPSNRITIGSIGVGGMGTNDMNGFISKPMSEVVAVCDVDADHLENARKIAKLDKKSSYEDFRELLERKDIDAVVVVTPDHWHELISIEAAKAGKDIYCEKPLTFSIYGGRVLADTVEQYGRILQTGSQQRSNYRFRIACEMVRNGRIGQLQKINVEIPGNNKENPLIWQEMPIPKGFNYNFWLGPAKYEPYTKIRCHYTFRFILDYSGGQMTNWGAHYLDIAQWGNNADDSGPVEIYGKSDFPKSGLFTTATRSDINYIYKNGVVLNCKTSHRGGITFEGTEGWIYADRGHLEASSPSILSSHIKPDEIPLYKSNDHKQNFLDCIKSRKKPITDAEIGHRSGTLCHLGNIATLTEQRLKWDPKTERFTNSSEANKMLKPFMRSPWKF
jgi:predicted dehydrogenase